MRVSAEQCLHSTKGFSAPPTAPPASRLGVPKALGGDTAGTSAPNSPKGYPTAREAVLSNKTGGWRMAGAALARGLAGHRSVGGEQLLSFASLGFLGLSFPHSFLSVGFFPLPFLFSFLSSLYLNPRVFSLLPFPSSPANPPAGERASGRVVLSRWPGLNRNNLSAKSSLARVRVLVLPPPSGCGHPLEPSRMHESRSSPPAVGAASKAFWGS